ncbi:DUF445 domain-containing protein [Syntrophomonas wolfei]|uniref:DUF445 domain-containing protein n=1 Tax=Syntrophomonas wolfei subsp. wolfei (strain DSM 2245B / Goettingen) TaxID=335541 RepID=Q0AY06_SYNWW|nr:DUF445 family protein [Syntrophomonas wolfei]ABI68398.1 conserved hypothetical protein [Syntrophomonas wolfei subsp. wolfei str. Goettingen G311]
MIWQIIAIPLISAGIGYMTNVVAIRLLFWPKKPIRIMFFEIYGLLPKRQAEIAAQLGQLVEEQLLSIDDLFDRIDTPETYSRLSSELSHIVRGKLYALLPRIIPGKVSALIVDNLDRILQQEAPAIFKQLLTTGRDYLNEEVQIKQIVENRVMALDLDELEMMIRGVSGTEIRFIELLGGILGFIIGLVQLFIISLTT